MGRVEQNKAIFNVPVFSIRLLNAASYAMRSVRPLMSQETLKMIQYAYFHFLITLYYGGGTSLRVQKFLK